MGLTSTALLLLAAVLALASPFLVLALWSRVPGPRAARAALRAGSVSVAQLLAVALVFVAVNDHFQFYTSWQDLLGTARAVPPVTAAGGTVVDGPTGDVTVYRGTSRSSPDGGRLVIETVRGDRSGITAQVLVHLPAGYDTSHRSYPVVELLAGWHGTPFLWLRNLHVLEAMKAAESAGAMSHVITVIPTVNVARGRDLECTDVPRGPQAETWLADDVRNFVFSQYRVLSSARGWALMGYSSGGYCAAKLLLHHPRWYAIALSLSGYFDAIRDGTTGDLWGGSHQLRDENSPLWLVTHRPVPAVDLLVFTSKQDASSYPSSSRFLRAAHAPMQTFAVVVRTGGHNFDAVRLALPELLGWLGGQLAPDSVLRKTV